MWEVYIMANPPKLYILMYLRNWMHPLKHFWDGINTLTFCEQATMMLAALVYIYMKSFLSDIELKFVIFKLPCPRASNVATWL